MTAFTPTPLPRTLGPLVSDQATLSAEERARYSRHILLPEFGLAASSA